MLGKEIAWEKALLPRMRHPLKSVFVDKILTFSSQDLRL